MYPFGASFTEYIPEGNYILKNNTRSGRGIKGTGQLTFRWTTPSMILPLPGDVCSEKKR